MNDASLIVRAAGWIILAGSVVFFAGAAYGVPQVFMTRAPEERLAVLRSRADVWRKAQWLYAAGPVTAGAGVLVLAAAWTGQAQLLAGASGVALLVGASLWAVTCARRSRRIEEFARGGLPVGPWLGYVWLSLAGLALLGLAGLTFATAIGAMLLIATGSFTLLFVITRDIPPFLFYLTLSVFAIWTLVASPL